MYVKRVWFFRVFDSTKNTEKNCYVTVKYLLYNSVCWVYYIDYINYNQLILENVILNRELL